MIAHMVGFRRGGWVTELNGSGVKSIVPCFDEARAGFARGHPVFALWVLRTLLSVHGVCVVFSPETDQASSDVANAWIAVVLVAELFNEIDEHLLDSRVVVVGRERIGVPVHAVLARSVDAFFDEIGGDSALLLGAVEVEAENCLVSAARNGVQHLIDVFPVVSALVCDNRIDRE